MAKTTQATDRLREIGEPAAFRAALLIWGLYALILAIIMIFQPDIGKVMTIYRDASAAWWRSEPIYVPSLKQGFFYLPQAAIFLTPILFCPVAMGEVIWRLFMLAVLAWSAWQVSGVFANGKRQWTFLIVSAVAVALSLSAARYGQTNVLLAAFIAMAAASLARAAWSSSALWLVLSLAAKPVGLVACLLAGACYPRKLVLPLAAATAVLVLVSFVHHHPSYVAGQYALFVHTMEFAQQTPKHSFCDLQGLLRTFGWLPPSGLMTAVRVLAAFGALFLAWTAVRRYDAARGAFVCMLLAVLYLLLFNPRTESNSYVLLAPFVGVLVADAARQPAALRRLLWLAAFAATMTCENWGALHKLTDLWLKAAATIVFCGFLVRDIITGRDPLGLRVPGAPVST